MWGVGYCNRKLETLPCLGGSGMKGLLDCIVDQGMFYPEANILILGAR